MIQEEENRLRPNSHIIGDRKGITIILRSLVFLTLLLITVYDRRGIQVSWQAYAIIVVLGLSNISLVFLPNRYFESQIVSGWIFFFDAILVIMLVSVLTVSPSMFLVAYFLAILIAATSRSRLAAFLATFVVTVLYGTLTAYGKTDVEVLSSPFFIRIVFFFVTAIFVGYLSEQIHAEHKSRKESEKFVRELQDLDQMKSDLIGMVSHELRTPMAPLKSAIEMLLHGKPGDVTSEQRKHLKIISRNVERLLRLATNLLTLSRLEFGEYPMLAQRISILFVIEPVVDHLKEEAENTILSIAIPPDICAFADPTAVSEVLGNLLSNAIVHTPEGAEVVVSSRLVGESCLEVSVSDNGPGISQDALENIFEKFAWVDKEVRREHKGLGLGLAVCKALVERMGGRISVESRPGNKTTFRFTLPTRETAEKA